MIKALKNHPFAVKAYFERSIVLSFAVPKEELIDLIPPCLSLDLFEDKYAFIACALVETKHLRPSILPSFMGNSFTLIGYRVFVRYNNQAGKNLRGLYILKSQTNKRKMEWLGNIFTHYKYDTIDIQSKLVGDTVHIASEQEGIQLDVDLTQNDQVPLPASSVFKDWKEARRFAGPLPFTFTFNQDKSEVLIIEGKRQNWKPRPIFVNKFKLPFLDSLSLHGMKLSNAFVVENIPYEWKKGKIEKWTV